MPQGPGGAWHEANKERTKGRLPTMQADGRRPRGRHAGLGRTSTWCSVLRRSLPPLQEREGSSRTRRALKFREGEGKAEAKGELKRTTAREAESVTQ